MICAHVAYNQLTGMISVSRKREGEEPEKNRMCVCMLPAMRQQIHPMTREAYIYDMKSNTFLNILY